MADLQPYLFEPERVSNPEDSESENKEVKNRLEGTFVRCISHVTICESSGKAHSSQEFEGNFYLQLKVL